MYARSALTDATVTYAHILDRREQGDDQSGMSNQRQPRPFGKAGTTQFRLLRQTRQMTEYSCGASALQSVLSYWVVTSTRKR